MLSSDSFFLWVLLGIFVSHSGCADAPENKNSTSKVNLLQNATVEQIQSHIARFSGEKPVLVNIWATWCLPCVEEFPYIMDLKSKYGDQFELVFISADFEEARMEATEFLESQGVNFTTFFKQGKDNDFIAGISEDWSGAIPYTLVIGKDGETQTEWEGKADYQDFENALLQVIQ